MKKLFLIISLLLSINAFANNIYFATAGNDANTGTINSPYKSIAKFNALTFSPGDHIFFNRGDVFYGGLLIHYPSYQITIGAYGTGANPVITGFVTVPSWTNLGGNIWESTNPVSTLPDLKMVVINGQSTPMGRYPNGDGSYPYLPNYYIFQSVTGTGSGASSIASSFLNATNWTGADVVVRINQWTLDKETITSQSGTTINYNGQSSGLAANWGFFIQNDIRTLDQQNEWYYNPATKKIDIYSTSAPTNVQVSTVDTLVNFYSNIPTVGFVNIDNIQFQGANTNAIWISGNLTFSVTNCNISYSGFEGLVLYGGGIKSGTISNNYFYGNGNSSIFSTGTVSNLTITNNNIVASQIVTAVQHNDYVGSAIQVSSPKSLIQYNTIDSFGYIGIGFRGDSSKVLNNFINHGSILKGDAAGIYTGFANEHGKVIDGNIILNSIGNPRGSRSNDHFTFGIYSDDLGTDMKITNNSIAYCRTGGIYLHNSNNLFVKNNNIYSCGAIDTEIMFANGGVSMDANTSFAGNVHDNTLVGNVIFATNQYQYDINYYAENGSLGEVSNFGILDSNYYVKINSFTAIRTQQNGVTPYNSSTNLASWQTQTGKDYHSKNSPVIIPDTANLKFYYNATNATTTIALDAQYIDAKNTAYNAGTLTLAPYSSAALIKTAPLNIVTYPTYSNAGADQTITLPANSVNLTGSGSYAGGSIASYAWSKISGPGTGIITNPFAAATTFTGLTAGRYLMQLTVTNNIGITASDSMLVVVNPANILPVANAGSNITITLPTNTTNLTGSGTDADGTIVAYAWIKISGPSCTIVTPAAATTAITGMSTAGTYTFQLQVTDNSGGTATSIVTVTVNIAANILPTANAGADVSITLPASSTTLFGGGTDVDGTIVSYAWSQISGPITGVISSPTSAATIINSLTTAGIYTFQLMVTDNSGGTAIDNVNVTVIPLPVIRYPRNRHKYYQY